MGGGSREERQTQTGSQMRGSLLGGIEKGHLWPPEGAPAESRGYRLGHMGQHPSTFSCTTPLHHSGEVRPAFPWPVCSPSMHEEKKMCTIKEKKRGGILNGKQEPSGSVCFLWTTRTIDLLPVDFYKPDLQL